MENCSCKNFVKYIIACAIQVITVLTWARVGQISKRATFLGHIYVSGILPILVAIKLQTLHEIPH